MIRIRLHGRGGQGIKTASQILGSAGFLAGYQAQDFPLYGAERRGAPITAYTRLDKHAILERGPFAVADMVLVGDETLLDDPIAAPLGGVDKFTAVFINTRSDPQMLADRFHLPVLPVTLNLTEICFRHLDKKIVLSSALSAAGARLMGFISEGKLLSALAGELAGLNMREEIIAMNMDLAREVYGALRPVSLDPRPGRAIAASPLIEIRQESVRSAAPLILAPGNMALRKTGNWRVRRPDIDYAACNGCGICYARCPEGGMRLLDNGKPEIDYAHCKGCLICAVECPLRAIAVSREAVSWT